MRKLFNFLIIGVFALLASCDKLNELPKFSDSDAFVAFDNTSLSVNEDGTTLAIPVTLASVKGLSATVNYTIIDGTAKEGVNFTLAAQSQSLTFDADNRTQNIVVNIINDPGVFTGDLKFKIQLSDDGTIKPDAQNICEVTIKDLDHPLADFLGTWTATAKSYAFGDVQWTVTIAKDPDDVTVLWVQNICYAFVSYNYTYPAYDTRFYGVVNSEKTTLSFPIGETCAYQYKDTYPISLYGLTSELNIIKSGNIIATMSADKKVLTFDKGVYTVDDTGYWDAIYPGMIWTKN